MKRNYLLVYHNLFTDAIMYRYFEEEEDMEYFIKTNLDKNKYADVLHKYKIKEVY